MRHLLFVHGIGNDDKERKWLDALNQGLREQGLQTVEERDYTVHAPSYLDLLDFEGKVSGQRPSETYKRSGDTEYARAGGRYWRALHTLDESGVRRFEVAPNKLGMLPADGPHGSAIVRLVKHANRYRRDAKRRNAVLGRIVEALPVEGELVIIAHSLGSVVARDLVYALPPGLKLRLLITIGTPLALASMREHLEDANRRFPYEIIGSWLNLVGAGDPITGFRALAQIEGQALDVFVDTGGTGIAAHYSTSYLANPSAGVALEWVDHQGSRPPDNCLLPDRPFPSALLAMLIGAQYGLRLAQVIDNADKKAQLLGAREFLMPGLAREIADAGYEHVTAADLLRDNAKWLGTQTIGDDELVACLLSAFMGNPVEPFDVDFSRADRVKALELLVRDLQRPTVFATIIEDSEKEARRPHREGQALKRAGLVAVGLAVVAAAPALVLAAAPAGLAGGAAFVAGLTALGPGGMLGGLGIVSVLGGAGGLTAGRALIAGTAAQVEATVIFLQAYARARQRMSEDHLIVTVSGRQEWFALVESEGIAADDLARLSLFSDKGAPTLKELERKLKTIDRALDWLRAQGLAPAQLPAGEE